MKIVLDSHQTKVQQALKNLASRIEENSDSYLEKFLNKIPNFGKNKIKKEPNSIYIHGDVGRGKSMLMQEFFNLIKNTEKLYFHFNSFMRFIHEALRDVRNEKKKYDDELIEALKRVAKSAKLICLDEFQVVDIADAMLLSRIFSYLFSKNIAVIFTSNSAPQNLYKNGLQRELFLEFVNNILLKKCQILNLDSPTDYRALYKENIHKRYFINNQKNRQEIKQIIDDLTNSKPLKPTILKVWGREVKIKKTYAEIAIIDFKDLCKNENSASDYNAICKKFNLIFLLNLPKLTVEDVNEARRFTLFIDEIYENKTALIISAAAKLSEIYVAENRAESFKRTISRLKEIKSDYYWKNSKANIG